MKLLMLILCFTYAAWGSSRDLAHRPHSFQSANGKAVFVDFETANYVVTYDIKNQTAQALATIDFYAPESGLPIFDSVETPGMIKLDGRTVQATLESTPDRATTLRIINKSVTSGKHRLVISLPLTELLSFKEGGVKSAFWTSDLSERQYLERYLPANFEFDQVKMSLTLKFIGGSAPQKIYTNGVVTQKDESTFTVEYPAYYTSSSIFFHTVPEGATEEVRFTLKSLDGRDIPAVVYTGKSFFGQASQLERLKSHATEVFHELESDYGAWPHPGLIVYNAGSGGMEYCGATMTSSSALGHEMFHSYFARGVMPANGNSGWLDEALASWRDEGYQSRKTLYGTSRMSAHPYYTRITDDAAYSFGERFMSYLNHRFESQGGLKPFLRHMHEEKTFSPLFVEEFIQEMGKFYGEDVTGDFKKYTYGGEDSFVLMKMGRNTHHQKMSLRELAAEL